MSSPILLDGVGKQYRIGAARARYLTAREAVAEAARAAVRRLGRARGRADADERLIWALRDVSLEVQAGEAVGIIGGNGAGKSTLLKILSRITEPTTGEVTLRGRVGSLLEVGTGFHPELTGRENVYLNGSILGMRRREIDRQFDAIVEFAEVGRFVDTPVKHYSSGMYLRLAFAVAAHLELEILLVDEVLAVGDAAFQKRCLGKMADVIGGGRTVLFVSHNADAVQRLCARSVLVEGGRVTADGPTRSVISRYLSRGTGGVEPTAWVDLAGAGRIGNGQARFAAARYSSGDVGFRELPYSGGPLEFTLAIDAQSACTVESLAVVVKSHSGLVLVNADTFAQGAVLRLTSGRNIVRMRFEALHLTPGVYTVALWLARGANDPYDFIEAAFDIEIAASEEPGFGATLDVRGIVACRFSVTQPEASPAVAAGAG